VAPPRFADSAPELLDEPHARRRQRGWIQAWLVAGYLVDSGIVAVFGWAGAVAPLAWAVYMVAFGALLLLFLVSSRLAASSSASREVVDSAARVVTVWQLLAFSWLYPPLTFYFLALVLMLLCFPHRRVRWPALRTAVEWAVIALPAGAVTLALGADAMPPLDDDAGQAATALAAATILARGAVVGYWSNELRALVAHFKEKYRVLSQNLESEVLARTRELEQRNEELAEINRQLQDIGRSVAHDFRQPIITIAGHAGALRRQLPDLDARHAAQLDRIVAAARQMELICDGMKRLMQVEQAVLSRSEVDVTALVQQLALSQPGAPGPAFEAAPGMRVQGDPRLLAMLLEILLANAWAACAGKTGARVRVFAETADGESCICVEDNGEGFSEAEADALFVPFARLHGGAEPGTGVSLAVAERIARRHGGRLTAHGRVGAGARFRLALPA
jgi:signal transduction histidine kinase